MARRQVFHYVIVPRMLEAGLRCKREMEASRCEPQGSAAPLRAAPPTTVVMQATSTALS